MLGLRRAAVSGGIWDDEYTNLTAAHLREPPIMPPPITLASSGKRSKDTCRGQNRSVSGHKAGRIRLDVIGTMPSL